MIKVNVRHSAVTFVAILFSSLLFGTALADQSVSYETIGNLRFKSLGLEAQNDQERLETKDIKQALTVSMNGDQKLRTVYQLCAQSEKKAGIDASSDSENIKILLHDLDVCGSLLDRVNYTHTYRGQASLAKMLANPLSNSTRLHNRQALIQKLVEDPALLHVLDSLLKKLNREETNLLSFWQDEAHLAKQLIETLYFNKKLPTLFKKNSTILEVGACLGHAKIAFALFGDIAIFAASTYFLTKIARKYIAPIPAVSAKDALLSAINFFTPFADLKDFIQLDNAENRLRRTLYAREIIPNNSNFTVSDCQLALRNGESITLKINIAFKTFLAALKLYTGKQAINAGLQVKNTTNYLQERLIGASTYVRAIDQLRVLAQQYPEIAEGLTSLDKGLKLLEHHDDDLNKLVTLLMTNTFKGHSSFFSHTGRVLAAYSLMQTEKDKLYDSLEVLGELDACVSAAHLYLEHQKRHVVYSFANYSEQEEPFIHAEGFWHPLVDEAVVVTNNLELGNPCIEHHMILTGSNKGGKSTLLKAMMIAALFSQTITLVPAEQFIATPFDYLATYLNITDNTAEGKSLFMAQVERTKMIVQATDALKRGNRALIIIDEFLTGTGVKKAAEAAYKVAEHLSASPYTCLIIATHYIDVLPKLEQTTNGRCKNFKFDADKDEQGKNIFRYKLEEGISQNNIAIDILNEELDGIDFF